MDSDHREKVSPYKALPCLRCGKPGIVVMLPKIFEKLDLSDLQCEQCEAPHYLMAQRENGFWQIVYDRDTRRYPSDHYDEFPHFRIMLRDSDLNHIEPANEPHEHYGPIVVYKRKRFSASEVRQIWIQSQRCCHECGKAWKLNQRGLKGWHIDHVIPNIGGGKETEMMANLRVACASCNLRKGRGYTENRVRRALASLFE